MTEQTLERRIYFLEKDVRVLNAMHNSVAENMHRSLLQAGLLDRVTIEDLKSPARYHDLVRSRWEAIDYLIKEGYSAGDVAQFLNRTRNMILSHRPKNAPAR